MMRTAKLTTNIETIISYILATASIDDYAEHCSELGGGELNDTYLLHCASRNIVLRIAKNPGRHALSRESRALQLLASKNIAPEVLFFDDTKRIDDREWILETFVPGRTPTRLTPQQFDALGELLATIHSVKSGEPCVSPWQMFIRNCQSFGDENYLLTHPDEQLRHYIHTLQQARQNRSTSKLQVLRHCDATPSNTLVDNTRVSLIDWEMSGFGDAMTDFSTGYWSDMELNNGKWRQMLSTTERQALYSGYRRAGGDIDDELALFYETLDKVGVAVYLYWRLHVSSWPAEDVTLAQYQKDYEAILDSLSRVY